MQEADYNQSQVHLKVIHLYAPIQYPFELKQETNNCIKATYLGVSLPQISPIVRSKAPSLQQVL